MTPSDRIGSAGGPAPARVSCHGRLRGRLLRAGARQRRTVDRGHGGTRRRLDPGTRPIETVDLGRAFDAYRIDDAELADDLEMPASGWTGG
jgi:hypothetical protein